MSVLASFVTAVHSDTTRALPPIGALERASLRLVVIEGDDAGLARVIDGPLRVGTSEACDVKLGDRTVSRRHMTIEPSARGVMVRDEGSRNGTWLGDARIVEAELGEGAELRIGATRLRVESAQEDEARGRATGVAAEPAPGPAPSDAREPRSSFGRFLGSDRALAPLYKQLERAAASDVTVLLEGESGTGKELLAEAIHEASDRKDGPFVVLDCGAMPESLIEAELFGHERGAFTGAERARAGAFEIAHGGTIFLDEIGELPLALQTRLLRALDRRQVRRLGASQSIDVDVRVIAATNRNLDREVEGSRFRLDLFHRIAVVLVRVPPLRSRPADLAALARHFVRGFGGDESLLSDEVLARMREHGWPGNVRELRNWVERLVLLGEDAASMRRSTLRGATVATDAAGSGLAFRQARALCLQSFTEAYIEDMLRRHGGNVSQAARAAGIARRYFQKLKER